MKEFKLFATLIQVSFIVMKLCGAIDWSWTLVMFPIIVFLVWMAFRFVFTIFCIKHEIKKSQDNLRNRMDSLRRLQQEQQEAMNKKLKEMDSRNEQRKSDCQFTGCT